MTTDYLAAVDRAEALFREGFSCSQAVLMAFAPGLGMDERQAALVSSAFGGGMARHGWTCGALTGALMAVGLHAGHATAEDTATKDELYARVQALVVRFEARHGGHRVPPADRGGYARPGRSAGRLRPRGLQDAVSGTGSHRRDSCGRDTRGAAPTGWERRFRNPCLRRMKPPYRELRNRSCAYCARSTIAMTCMTNRCCSSL